MAPPAKKNIDLLCFSHLRWNFVYQRPQHLMSRFAKERRVFFIEEAIYDAPSQYNEMYEDPQSGVYILTPHLTRDTDDVNDALRSLLRSFMASMEINEFIAWYYTPLALAYTSQLTPDLIVYDCMDELSSFRFASPAIKDWEQHLFEKADLAFTGGMHLYQAKKDHHPNIHAFPSGIDVDHFVKARNFKEDPFDQKAIPHPRIGFFGVIDERFNIDLLAEMAAKKPGWHFVIIGPTAKIDPSELPRTGNIHYLGMKDYKELPDYLAGWDVAMMPFALNDATKYISPTKTPEFLAAGKPVVSTSIHDVVHPYGEKNLVSIADTADDLIFCIDQFLSEKRSEEWLNNVDAFLATMSWDDIWNRMEQLIDKTMDRKKLLNKNQSQTYV